VAALVLALGCGGGGQGDGGPKVIVLGFDGMDYGLARHFMETGAMPNFARLAESGRFGPLGTSVPPLSPVAWSNFITGMDAGGHGIFDFIHRDPERMIPEFSTSKAESSERTLKLGKWQIPLGSGKIELLRKGEPFWSVLERRGVETTIIRMPANFPPSGSASRELSGMGTIDILGSPGIFSYYTSELFAADRQVSGGVIYEAWEEDGVVHAELHGPDNPFLVEKEEVTADFELYPDPEEPIAKLVVGSEERLLKVGEWSDWVPVTFELIPTQSLHGMCRFYLKALRPELQLYVSPINFDPLAPDIPISTPEDYATELARRSGRFYTQGMPEDVQALKAGVLDRREFLAQAKIAGDEIRRQYEPVLADFTSGLLFYYFGNLDQVSHMMFRAIDRQHPRYDPVADAPFAGVIEELYRQADEIVGYTLDHMADDTLLIVMSDHGFASLRRRMSLNTWLYERGYLAVKNPDLSQDPGFFANIDWSRTRAYAVGLNGLYVNLAGRERDGIVPPAERRALMEEIAAELLATIDPATGQPAVTKVYRREEVYRDRGAIDVGPDLIIGFARGTGGADDSSLGGVPPEVFTDNDGEWTGDHGMDHETVPGILLTSRPLKRPATELKNLAASILAELGVEGFPATADPGEK